MHKKKDIIIGKELTWTPTSTQLHVFQSDIFDFNKQQYGTVLE